ncbi:hypothetical protein C9374_002820 [Naegleria lovaniensis]|uniref:Uncharacterized protein n=1 Tax=Naegleria lovaniensis TaxID=51637 RepID=A0AA88GVB0_NAELO|nr:uncharacterized protein C9374_002820 [Naegleria lovaniensis]KAG2386374.1 hypothetical protein C9374_002820 [Naegleria lovaniensis]
MKELLLKETPSLAFNNLLVHTKGNVLCYISNGSIVTRNLSDFFAGKGEEMVIPNLSEYEVKNLAICMNGKCLAASCEIGVLFYDIANFSLLYFYKIEGNVTFSYGPLASDEHRVYVGDSSGNITCFRLNSMDDIQFESSANIATVGITALQAFSDSKLCAGLANGDIAFINNLNTIIKLHKNKVEALEYPCTGIQIVNDTAVTAFGSGHVRLYILKNGFNKMAEIGAHSKGVSALHAFEDKGAIIFATTSEDCSVFIWKYEHEFSAIKGERIKDCLLTGVQFVESNRVLVSSFEKKSCYLLEC